MPTNLRHHTYYLKELHEQDQVQQLGLCYETVLVPSWKNRREDFEVGNVQ